MYVNCPKETVQGNFTTGKGDCFDRVHSDQMVLGTVRQMAGPRKRAKCAKS
jgi:hypothetical protein